jgi:hypothetical protein
MMKKGINDYFLTITQPDKSFERLLKNENHISLGLLFILIPIIAYTLMYIFLTIGHGAPSVFTPWLNIPKESYYAVNRFLLAPSMFLCWLATTAFIQLMSKLMNGKGTFEQTLSVLALSISISMLGGLLHDLPMSFLSAIGVIDARQHEIDMNSPTIYRTLLWICYSIYFLGFIILFPKAVKAVHQLTWPKSIIIGISGFLVFQFIFLIFNR